MRARGSVDRSCSMSGDPVCNQESKRRSLSVMRVRGLLVISRAYERVDSAGLRDADSWLQTGSERRGGSRPPSPRELSSRQHDDRHREREPRATARTCAAAAGRFALAVASSIRRGCSAIFRRRPRIECRRFAGIEAGAPEENGHGDGAETSIQTHHHCVDPDVMPSGVTPRSSPVPASQAAYRLKVARGGIPLNLPVPPSSRPTAPKRVLAQSAPSTMAVTRANGSHGSNCGSRAQVHDSRRRAPRE